MNTLWLASQHKTVDDIIHTVWCCLRSNIWIAWVMCHIHSCTECAAHHMDYSFNQAHGDHTDVEEWRKKWIVTFFSTQLYEISKCFESVSFWQILSETQSGDWVIEEDNQLCTHHRMRCDEIMMWGWRRLWRIRTVYT